MLHFITFSSFSATNAAAVAVVIVMCVLLVLTLPLLLLSFFVECAQIKLETSEKKIEKLCAEHVWISVECS